MKTLFSFILFLGIVNFVYPQSIPESVIQKNNLTKNSSFYEIQSAMNQYWDSKSVNRGFIENNGEKSKVPYWKIYKRWEYYWEQRINLISGRFPSTNSVDEFNKFYSFHPDKLYSPDLSNWVNLGTNSTTGGYAGLGRINCVAFHPTDPNTIWIGSPSGGIWRTTNGGTNWTVLNDNQNVIGVSDIIIPPDYATSNTIYIATGDRDGGSYFSLNGGQTADNNSIGVLKSTNGGNTWFATGLTYSLSNGKLVFKLLIHPSNNNILFASTSDGIYKTTNAGVTWTLKTLNQWIDMEFKPGDPNIIYASSFGYTSTYINRSYDNGENWSYAQIASNGRRGEIAVTPADPSIVYLLSANSSGGVYGIYKSINSGVNFSVVNSGSPSGMLGYYTDGSGGNGGQGSYDWCIAVSPTNANIVFIGGITTWKSINGGVNFTANTCWTSYSVYNKSGVPVTHADKHALIYNNSGILFEGNDGGIYKTTNNGSNWSDLSNGLTISQIYRIGVSQTSQNTIISGLQDNGSKLFSSGVWNDVTGGDGMECIVDYTTTTYMYATYVEGEIYRSADGGVTFPTTISANITGGQPVGYWVTPYIIDPVSNTTLYAGYDKVWKTINRGNTWTSASQVLSSTNKLRSLAIAPSNNSFLYAADPSNMWKTTNGGATNWTTVTLPNSSTYLTYISVKSSDPNTLWISYGGYDDGMKIYQSTNGGANWTNISSGLPNIPVMCIIQYKSASNRNVLFAGTDMGVYLKDGSNDWSLYNTGLPNVCITELDIYYNAAGDRLRAATYGRGLWETLIESALPIELFSFTQSVNKNTVQLNWVTKMEINNKRFDIERTESNKNNWQICGSVDGHGNSNQNNNYSFTDAKLSTGKYNYRLRQIDFNGNFKIYNLSDEVIVGIPDKFTLSQNYPNPFNPKTKIDYQLPFSSRVSIVVFNALGQEISVLVNEVKEAGYYTAEFNSGTEASGVYFYKIITEKFSQVKTMLLLK